MIRASAPGKLILLGEYAVLDGAPALVQAVDVRAVVELSTSAGPEHALIAPDILAQPLAFTFSEDGRPLWRDAPPQAPLGLLEAVFAGLASLGLRLPADRAWRLSIDTSAFTTVRDGVRMKLGLGSSAALTVALASALAVAAGAGAGLADRANWLRTLLILHRRFQGGRGSGADLAAALHGGSFVYRLAADDRPQVEPVSWPEELHRLPVWVGAPASTTDFLAGLSAWRGHAPDQAEPRMTALCELARRGARAARDGDAVELLAVCADYAVELRRLGEAGKMDIVSSEHQRVGELARSCGAVYKPCGAGGGDFGVGLALGGEALSAFHAELARAGFVLPPPRPAGEGLRIDAAAG